MDISERRMPQDGRIQMKLSRSRAIDFRVNTLPTLFGEKSCCVSSTPPVPRWVSMPWGTSRNKGDVPQDIEASPRA